MAASLAVRWLVILSILALLIVAIFLLLGGKTEAVLHDALSGLQSAAAIAGFIIAALALDVALPIPSSVVNVSAGALLGFAGGTLASWIGMTIGCLVGYWVGATGGTVAFRKLLGPEELNRSAAVSERFAVGSLLVMRAVPVLAETSTVAAGIAGVPLQKFVSVVALANLGLAASYSLVGAFALETNSFLLAFAAAITFPLAAMAGHLVYRHLSTRSTAGGAPRAAAEWENTAISGVEMRGPSSPEPTILQRISVDYQYRVSFTQGLFDPANETLLEALSVREPGKRHRCLVFVDEGVTQALPQLAEAILAYGRAHRTRIEIVDGPVPVPGGEQVKTERAHIEAIQDRIHCARIDRHSYVMAVGGGAMLDAVGLAAATAHRGVRLVRVPTTVLAQNDSGVGVKNAVNLKGIKNYLGTFAPPWAVLNDYEFIRALPERERIAGIAEAVKVALIRDGAFFRWLEENADRLATFEPEAERYMIRRCAELHMLQIAKGGDPFEMGSARPLDYGHWSAHKLEAMTRHRVNHGEAVAIGLALDTRYSVLAGLLAKGEELRVVNLLERLGLRTYHQALGRRGSDGRLDVVAGLEEFREHLGGELTITLLSALGTGVEVHEIETGKVADAIAWLRARAEG